MLTQRPYCLKYGNRFASQSKQKLVDVTVEQLSKLFKMPYPTFHDGRRSIDFVLVYKVSALAKAKRIKRFKTFTIALKALGLQLEMSHFTVRLSFFTLETRWMHISG